MRNKRLDVLRCIAVVTVMLHHSEALNFFTRIGWVGVDLFFVLSGFLISGLLFSEYKKTKTLDFKRFFVRRGLKIYPSFYIFLLSTSIVSVLYLRSRPTAAQYFHEIFFIMNYKQGIWDHAWSLGVEEHFYIFLPIFLLICLRFSSNTRDPFRAIPWAAAATAAMCPAFRALSVCVGTPNTHAAYVATHNRIDALFCGVLIGYFFHFRPELLERLVSRGHNRLLIAMASAVFILSAYVYTREDWYFAVFGYSLVYLGFAGVLILSLYMRGISGGKLKSSMQGIGSAAAYLGMYSYSIYLWQRPFNIWLPGLIRRAVGHPIGKWAELSFFVIGTFAIGIAMAKLVEYPILRFRDRVLPSSASAVPAQVNPDSEAITVPLAFQRNR